MVANAVRADLRFDAVLIRGGADLAGPECPIQADQAGWAWSPDKSGSAPAQDIHAAEHEFWTLVSIIKG